MHRKPFSYTEAMQGKTKIQKQQNNSLSCFSSSPGISLPNEDVLFLFREIKILKIRKFPLKVHYSEPQQFLRFIFSFSHLSSDSLSLFSCQEYVEYIYRGKNSLSNHSIKTKEILFVPSICSSCQ